VPPARGTEQSRLLAQAIDARGTLYADPSGMIKLALALLISAVTVGPVDGQTPPDLAGTWTMDEARSGSPTHEGFTSPVVWIIEQSHDSFRLDRNRGGKVLSHTYVLQAKPSGVRADTTVVSPSGDSPIHRGTWDGQRLNLETLQNIQGKTVTTREVLSLSSDGRELTVERVVEVEHGYTMKDAQNYNTVKDVFRRATP